MFRLCCMIGTSATMRERSATDVATLHAQLARMTRYIQGSYRAEFMERKLGVKYFSWRLLAASPIVPAAPLSQARSFESLSFFVCLCIAI